MMRYKFYDNPPYKLAKLMLEKGANVNLVSRGSSSYPLFYAVSHNDIALVKLLLSYNANKNIANKRGQTILQYAIRTRKKPEIILLLKGLSANSNQLNIFDAAKVGNYSHIQKLLDKNPTLVNKHEQSSGFTALHYAAQFGKLKVAQLLLEKGAPINAVSLDNRTALLISCSHVKPAIAMLLIKKGADPNIQAITRSKCSHRLSAFDWAVIRGNHYYPKMMQVLKAMWDSGRVDLNKTKAGRAGHIFIRATYVSTLKILVEHCKLTPSREYLTWLRKQRYEDRRKLYRYLAQKGFR